MRNAKTFTAIFMLSGTMTSNAIAGMIDSPFVQDSFPSTAVLELSLLPAWTGLPSPIPATVNLTGPTTVLRETAPFVQDGLDTIDTEIVSMDLTGTGLGFPIRVRAGAGNGFLPGLDRSGGQIQDLPSSPQDLVIDFPADSIFDVFFDVWVDLNADTIVDVGEVVRNFEVATRMQKPDLAAVPPPPGTVYEGINGVQAIDPNIGMFSATLFAPLPVELFVVNADGSQGPLHATARELTHRVVPEPATLALLGLGIAGIGYQRRKRLAA